MALKTGATLVSRLPLIVATLPENIDDAVRKGAELIADSARSKAPVGSEGRRGEPAIRDSIRVRRVDSDELGKRQNTAKSTANDLGILPGLVNQTVAYTVEAQARSPRTGRSGGIPYALMVEFGTETGQQGPNTKKGAFMVPAFYEKEQEVVDLVADELDAL